MDLRTAELYEKKMYGIDRTVLKRLLQDKSTKKNIIFATDAYANYGYQDSMEMTIDRIFPKMETIIKPRYQKSQDEQKKRTRKKAEVFTPTWLCCYMNNVCDDEWFGRKDVFCTLNDDHTWQTAEHIDFGKKSWQKYVDSTRIEITCGEAPYLVSRYDTVTGKELPIDERIGLLDRKLRAVSENTDSEEEWMKWVIRAYQSIYGFEYQGDSLLLARVNLLFTFMDFMEEKWGRKPTVIEQRKIANIIAWNIWQMDGLKGTAPLGAPYRQYEQISLFDLDNEDNDDEREAMAVPCVIKWWRSNETVKFMDIGKNGGK